MLRCVDQRGTLIVINVQAIVCATMLSMFAFGCASTTAVPEPPDAGVQADSAKTTETASNDEGKHAEHGRGSYALGANPDRAEK